MRSIWRAWRPFWTALHETGADAIEQIPAAWVRRGVVLASALGLYVEMVMIRWHATSAHAFSIFKNISLLSCFLGLGLGYALADRRRSLSLATFLPLLAVQTVLFGLIASTIGGTRVNPVAEQVVMGLPSWKWNWWQAVGGNAFLASIFLLNAIMFVPLGYLAGRLMRRLPPLQGYSLNLLGSLLGIGLFFALSLLWTPPIVWMAVAVLLCLPFLWRQERVAYLGVSSLAVMMLVLGAMGKGSERVYYSPYQTIALKLPQEGLTPPVSTIKVNHAFYQEIRDCTPQVAALNRNNRETAEYYNLPYRICPQAGDVLVVGAGTGNDVAAALRNNARSVTAVEIDPAILYIGRCLHPEGPYQDPRTQLVLNDARSYLRQTDDRFDTIVYGLLDSHTNLGAMTNVRLDSFVYTVEGFREAVERLKPGGLVVVTYEFLYEGHADKIYAMLHAAYPDQPPRVFSTWKGKTYVTGPGLATLPAALAGIDEETDQYKARAVPVALATDDWPYFYMQERTYPVTYLAMILLLLVLSAWLVKQKLGSVRVASPRTAVFFFLGAGFMLVETKVITELGLTFGNTWSVNAVAITGVLLMAYLANQWIVRRGPVQSTRAFLWLGLSLAAGYALSTSPWVPMAKLVLPVVLTLPLFFEGLLFSSELAGARSSTEALSANLFGAMLGGFLEYNSMYFGLGSLYLFGVVLYALAFACSLRAHAAADRELYLDGLPPRERRLTDLALEPVLPPVES